MRKIKEILRLKMDLKRTNREIAKSIGISNSTVGSCLRRFSFAGLKWPSIEEFDDEKLEALLYSPPRNQAAKSDINWQDINEELKRKGMTLWLLWSEYKTDHPQGISYSRFCDLYKKWRQKLDICLRQSYKAGEKMFVDYAGITIPIIGCNNGEICNAQIFVAVLGASNYTYIEATFTQTLPDWIASHVKSFEFFGGIPEIVVSDNLKSGVSKAHRYEPDINPTYQDMAAYYGVTVMPARAHSPQDKAKVEEAVQHVERRILAKFRNRIFFSLHELNCAIKIELEELNRQPFQKLPGSRLSQFESLEKATLKPLPLEPYIFAEWKKATVGMDYHVALDGHYYSVPYNLVKKELDSRYTQNTVEFFYKSKRVASHKRSYQKGAHTALTEHMPKSHQEYTRWNPKEIMHWAETHGEATVTLFTKIMGHSIHKGFRICVGIISLGKSYGEERLEAACKRALGIGAYSYKSIESILKNNLDQMPLISEQSSAHITELDHENVRGADYYH
ncbi:MAG: IS21 family transposase [Bacteroidia bacterium]|nr:IS21 family transposase [Bacteroidia bacterium]